MGRNVIRSIKQRRWYIEKTVEKGSHICWTAGRVDRWTCGPKVTCPQGQLNPRRALWLDANKRDLSINEFLTPHCGVDECIKAEHMTVVTTGEAARARRHDMTLEQLKEEESALPLVFKPGVETDDFGCFTAPYGRTLANLCWSMTKFIAMGGPTRKGVNIEPYQFDEDGVPEFDLRGMYDPVRNKHYDQTLNHVIREVLDADDQHTSVEDDEYVDDEDLSLQVQEILQTEWATDKLRDRAKKSGDKSPTRFEDALSWLVHKKGITALRLKTVDGQVWIDLADDDEVEEVIDEVD